MNGQVISFNCILKNKMGQILGTTFNRDVLTYDENQKEVMTGLSEGLRNLRKGERRKISLSAKQAYGFYRLEKVLEIFKEDLPQGQLLKEGEEIVRYTSQGQREIYRVTHISADKVTLDCNHPLAGQDLIFEIEATEVREATAADTYIQTTRPPC